MLLAGPLFTLKGATRRLVFVDFRQFNNGENPMNKKLISLAVATAITAPAAALADATFYGKAHMSIDWFQIEDQTEDLYEGWALSRGKIGKGNSRASRLGVKGSEDLGAGLKAIYQVEFGIPLAGERDYNIINGDQGGLKMRNTYVGLKGGFGTILAGRYDSPLKQSTVRLELFNDTMADYAGAVGFDDNRFDSTVAYLSPSYGGFQLAAAIVPGSSSSFGDYINRESESLIAGHSIAAAYQNGPWHAGVAYEALDESLSSDKAMVNLANEAFEAGLIDADDLADVNALHGNTDDSTKWRAGVGVSDWNNLYLSTLYEHQKNANFYKDTEADIWQAQAGYSFGNNMVKAMYGKRSMDSDSEADTQTWAFGLDHAFSKRTKAYALYTNVDAEGTDEGDWKGFSLGMIHNF